MNVPKLKLNINYLVLTFVLFFIETLIATYFKSGFIRHTLGDFLVVILIYCFFRSFTKLSVKLTCLITLAIAFIVEIIQLTPFLKWLNLDTNQWARVIFGTHFSITDLFAYTLGILLVLITEIKLCKN